MADLVANVAVVGRFQLMPGVLPVRLEDPGVECLVAHALPPKMESAAHGICIDTMDCSVFTVTHRERGDLDLALRANVQRVFEQSLAAISEVVIWCKAKDRVGKVSSFMRQVGTTDVKAFFVQGAGPHLVGWLNPAHKLERKAAAMMASIFPNMIVSNGPSATPVPAVTRRVMGSLDLVNLGFFTEAFVSLFALVDDLTQDVMKAGLINRGLSHSEQKELLRAIKEDRLKHYLCNVSKLCGWQSLAEVDKGLFNRVRSVNTMRNNVMHGPLRLPRHEAVAAMDTLLRLIGWLRGNPFGVEIPAFPAFRLAEPVFSIVPEIDAKESTGESEVPPPPPPE